MLSLNYDDAFELTGFGRFNRLVRIGCCFIFMYCSMEMCAIAYIINPVECELKLTLWQKSLINSAVYIGMIFTSICWGSVSDRYGRKKVILPALITAMISSFLSSVTTKFWFMFPLRVFTGCVISAATATILVYLAELHTKSHRDVATAIAITSDQINFIFLPGIAYLILMGTWSIKVGYLLVKPWRVFMWIWILYGLIGVIILSTLPESPRFVFASAGPLETLPILAKIYAWNFSKSPSDYPVKNIKSCPSVIHLSTTRLQGLRGNLYKISQLLRPPIRRCYVITHFCMFISFMISNGLYVWMPPFINDALEDVSSKCSICCIISERYINNIRQETAHNDPYYEQECIKHFHLLMYPVSMAMEAFYLIPYVIVIYAIDKMNIRQLYSIMFLICGAGLLISSFCPQVVVAMIGMTIGVCTGSIPSILTALVVEAFPTSLRALAMCTMYMIGLAGSILGVNVIGLMSGVYCYITFGIIFFCILSSVFIILKLWPDTKMVRAEMEKMRFSY